MMRDDAVYLRHILDAIHRIETYIHGISKEKYMQEGLLQDGVVRQLEIIGEASNQLSDEFQEKHVEVPWGQIVGLRNRIVHAYFDINLEITWDIVHEDIPELKQQVEHILAS